MSGHPAWADAGLCRDLVDLRARGEGQGIEYIAAFPQQAHDLAKEIAAFATSNTGMILLGVTDEGALVGLDGVVDMSQRDRLMKRLEGICNGAIKPAVTPRAAWAVEGEKIVLVVVIPKGSEPLYYSNGKPYLRHLSSSRPAEPHEVIDLVRRHLDVQPSAEESADPEMSGFYNDLAGVLNSILLWTEITSDERWSNPWLTEWMTDCGYAAAKLRDLASTDSANQLNIHARLLELAAALQEVADFTVTIGSGRDLAELDSRVRALANKLNQDTIEALPPTASLLAEGKRIVRQALRKLTELVMRAEQTVASGFVEQVQAECGEIGRQLMRLAFYNLEGLRPGFSQSLRTIGTQLRLLEIERVYMDGGDSLGRIVDGIRACQHELDAFVADVGN